MSKYENLWKLLNDYDFQIDTVVHHELTCGICKNIMVNAHQSICGCRYCFVCIVEYLNGAEKCCPGSTKDCREHMLNPEKGFQIDHVANMKVSKLCVKCPESDCEIVDELRNIDDHLKSHRIKCPYFEIGCNRDLSIKIEEHLHDNHLFHSSLMIDSFQNLKNELSTVREISEKKDVAAQASQTVIDQLMCTAGADRELINRLFRDLADCNVANSQLREDLAALKNEMRIMKLNNEKKETMLNNLNNKINKTSLQSDNKVVFGLDKVNENSEKLNKISQKIEENCQKTDQNSKNISKNSQKINQNFQNIENLTKSVSQFNEDLAKLANEMSNKDVTKKINNSGSKAKNDKINPAPEPNKLSKNQQNKLNKINKNEEKIDKIVAEADKIAGRLSGPQAPLTWTVDRFSDQQKKRVEIVHWFVLSKPFYSDARGTGYKLCLRVHPSGCAASNNSHLAVGFHLMQGEHDDLLEWPMMRPVTLGLLDQESGVVTHAETFEYRSTPDNFKSRWGRPMQGAMNKARLSTHFIELARLLGDNRLYRYDSIVLHCSVAAAATSTIGTHDRYAS